MSETETNQPTVTEVDRIENPALRARAVDPHLALEARVVDPHLALEACVVDPHLALAPLNLRRHVVGSGRPPFKHP